MNYYEILQISQNASDEVIKAAYRSLVKKYHPDAGIEKDSESFKLVEQAFNILSDQEKRKAYDEELRHVSNYDGHAINKDALTIVSSENKTVADTHIPHKRKVSRFSFGELVEVVLGLIGTLIGIAVVIFVVWCLFIGNGEKLKMELFDKLGWGDEISKEGTEYNVIIYTKYKDGLLSSDPDVWLNVDGERVALLSAGKENVYNAILTEGKHVVFVESKFWHINSTKLKIEVNSDNIFFFTIESGTWTSEITNGY